MIAEIHVKVESSFRHAWLCGEMEIDFIPQRGTYFMFDDEILPVRDIWYDVRYKKWVIMFEDLEIPDDLEDEWFDKTIDVLEETGYWKCRTAKE